MRSVYISPEVFEVPSNVLLALFPAYAYLGTGPAYN